jgi:RNA polymerase sigma-70 factor (ECF subfamily)
VESPGARRALAAPALVARALRLRAATMMRISELSSSPIISRFRLEGRLTRDAVDELLALVEPATAAGATVLLDLAGLAFADGPGIEALLALRRRGVVLAGCSSFLGEVLRAAAAARRRPEAPAGGGGGEAALLVRLRCGEAAAFTALVEANTGRMLAVAQRILRNEHEAHDAVQEAFLMAFKGLPAFNGSARLSTWLHRITVNACLMRLRRRKHRAEQPIDDLLPRFDEAGHWADEPGRLALSSDELLERRETRVAVRRCIDRLPETYRTVLLMRDIEDLDTDAVAALLGITPNAVKIRLHRARQALRTLLEAALGAPASTAAPALAAPPRAAGAVR